MQSVILGCGEVGRRLVKALLLQGYSADNIIGFVKSSQSMELCAQLGVIGLRFNLDKLGRDLSACNDSSVYYMVAPQKTGETDLRSEAVINHMSDRGIRPKKVVLISTTGVYGDCNGEWVTELSETKPQTERGKRRLNSEQQWLHWGKLSNVPVVVLRVPGIYANSRLPRERIAQKIPVVRPEECGFTNRIHADDLALMCVAAMRKANAGEVFNATDGVPGKISEYLTEAAKVLGLESPPEISMDEGQSILSSGMLSYLSESRKISNDKILRILNFDLRYPDFREGIKY